MASRTPISGAWKGAQSGANPNAFASPEQWGHGINPVHSVRRGWPGRNTTPGTPGGDMSPEMYDAVVIGGDPDYTEIDLGGRADVYGYTSEDSSASYTLYGNNEETGFADRTDWGTDPALARADADFPQWGPYFGGQPGGMGIRSWKRGSGIGLASKTDFPQVAYSGGENKLYDPIPLDADISDPSQYEMQTSMRQRDQTREGSQRSGSASEYAAPIRSRIIGPRLKVLPGGYRHEDMVPQTNVGGRQMVRPFRNRTAGTGPLSWMEPNDMYVSQPLNRVPPDGPEQNIPNVGESHVTLIPGDNLFGYVDEDVVY